MKKYLLYLIIHTFGFTNNLDIIHAEDKTQSDLKAEKTGKADISEATTVYGRASLSLSSTFYTGTAFSLSINPNLYTKTLFKKHYTILLSKDYASVL